jgi:hypothetical protein
MNSGIRAARAMHRDGRRQDVVKSFRQVILDAIFIGLTLPTAEGSAVVGDCQFQSGNIAIDSNHLVLVPTLVLILALALTLALNELADLRGRPL